jgi:hypothetical protein
MSPTSMVISLGSPVVQNLRYPHINIDQILVLKEGKVLKKHYCSVVPGKKKPGRTSPDIMIPAS